MAYDPVRFELIKNGIGSVVDEMVLTVVRIASPGLEPTDLRINSPSGHHP